MKPTTTQPQKPYPVWIYVFEIRSASTSPRSPHKPHVRVERKAVRPGRDLDAWLARARDGKKSDIVRVLEEAMPRDHEQGGLHDPFVCPRDDARIKKALQRLREKLRCEGYTIGGDTTVWHVYAIELDDSHLAKKPKGYRGHVYVGQTSHGTEERVQQHRLGTEHETSKGRHTHSTYCHNHFRRHAPELVPPGLRGPLFCRRRALQAERDLRWHLEAQGYRVEGGTELLPKKKPKKEPRDAKP